MRSSSRLLPAVSQQPIDLGVELVHRALDARKVIPEGGLRSIGGESPRLDQHPVAEPGDPGCLIAVSQVECVA